MYFCTFNKFHCSSKEFEAVFLVFKYFFSTCTFTFTSFYKNCCLLLNEPVTTLHDLVLIITQRSAHVLLKTSNTISISNSNPHLLMCTVCMRLYLHCLHKQAYLNGSTTYFCYTINTVLIQTMTLTPTIFCICSPSVHACSHLPHPLSICELVRAS